MTLSEHDLETRLRRTFAAVADVPLDDPMPEAAISRRRPVGLLVVAAAAAAIIVAAVVLVDGDERVSTVADGGQSGSAVVAYFPTPEENEVLFRAEQLLVRECMEAAGQPYVEGAPGPEHMEANWNRLGRTDAQRADRIGYVVPEGMGGRNPAMDRLRTAAERDAWSRAFSGNAYAGPDGPSGSSVPLAHPVTGAEIGRQDTGGCYGEMLYELYGDVSRHSSLQMWVSNDLRNVIEGRVVGDARFASGIGRWSSCMKDRGYDYDDPFGPVREFSDKGGTGRPTARELAVARADVECKDVTGLVRLYEELQEEHGRAVTADHEALLVEYRAIVDRALATARALRETRGSITTTTVPGGR